MMKQKKRLHFGVLFSSIDNTCQCKIWEGIVDFAQKRDINLTAYLGTYQFKDEVFDSHYETCFEAIKNSPIDGLILFSGFIAEDIGIEKFNAYIESLPKNLPIVSVSFPLKGFLSVLIDNEKGTFDTVEHLIKNHSKNKIVFIKGPNGHPEAESRFCGYKKALEKNGLKYDENYVLNGHFSRKSGQEAVAELIDKRKILFDAVVACDDETAIGAMKELDDRNILVPTNAAVAGFDDDIASETHIPSLSTARQPFFEIGKASADTLFAHISGKVVPEVCLVSPDFIARQSCGCLEESVLQSMSKRGVSASESFIYSFVLQKLLSYFPNNIPTMQIHSWATVLVEKIKDKNFSRTKFLHLFNDILVHYRRYSHDFSVWHGVVGILFDGVEHHKDEVINSDLVFSALASASVLIHNIHSKEGKSRELAFFDEQWLIRKLMDKLILTFDFDGIGEKLQQILPEFSMSTAIIGLYRNPIPADDNVSADRTIDNIIGFDKDRKIRIEPSKQKNPISFADYSSIVGFDSECEMRTMFFIPLFFNNEELGVVILPYNNVNSIDIYETLRVNISAAVKGAELLAKVQKLSITDELTGLLNRRGFFQFAYSRLPCLCCNEEVKPVVLFLDMDGLKLINDNYGHKEGDTAIAVCAKLLSEVLRDKDIIGRVGGDEFVVFSSVKNAEDSDIVIKRIRKKFDEYNAENRHPYSILCSVGAMVLPPNATKEVFDSAIQKADDILYEEKKEKRKKGLARNG